MITVNSVNRKPGLVRDFAALVLQYGLSGATIARIAKLLGDSDGASLFELSKIQRDKFRSLYFYAADKSEFYRTRFNSAKLPTIASDSVSDFMTDIPTLTKDQLRQNSPAITAYSDKRVTWSRTGGTTGTPLSIAKDYLTIAWSQAALIRGRTYAGIRPSDRGIMIKSFSRPSLKGRARSLIGGRMLVPAFQSGCQGREQEIFDAMESGRWQFIEGYVSDLVELSENMGLSRPRLNAVFTTGEMLYPHQRELIENRFGCPVFSYYGSNEIGGLAFQCDQGTYHVSDEHVHLEVVDDARKPIWDKPGRILVTDLDNFAMPLIRYEIGDEGVLTRERCSCGRAHTVLASVKGRTQDYIVNGKGRRLSATFLAGFFRDLQHIGRLQLSQLSPAAVRLDYEGSCVGADQEAKQLCNEIRSRLGNDIEITARHVNSVFISDRGKVPLIRHLEDAPPEKPSSLPQ